MLKVGFQLMKERAVGSRHLVEVAHHPCSDQPLVVRNFAKDERRGFLLCSVGRNVGGDEQDAVRQLHHAEISMVVAFAQFNELRYTCGVA